MRLSSGDAYFSDFLTGAMQFRTGRRLFFSWQLLIKNNIVAVEEGISTGPKTKQA